MLPRQRLVLRRQEAEAGLLLQLQDGGGDHGAVRGGELVVKSGRREGVRELGREREGRRVVLWRELGWETEGAVVGEGGSWGGRGREIRLETEAAKAGDRGSLGWRRRELRLETEGAKAGDGGS